MFNPFKKKNNSFKLDDISLPSLNEGPSSTPEMPSLDSSNQNPPNLPSIPELPSMDSTIGQETSVSDFSQNNFETPMPSANSNPMLSSPALENNNSQTNNNVQNDITKAQLETMMSKINLMDARQQNMEQKLEMIYQIILNEISEDSKRKLNIDSMMSKIKQ